MKYESFNKTMNMFKKMELKYNQTDLIVRYFFGEPGPVVYSCEESSHVDAIEYRNLTLCSKSYYI